MNKKIVLWLLILISFFAFRTVVAEESATDTEVTVTDTAEEEDLSLKEEEEENGTDTVVETIGESSRYQLIVEDDAHLLSEEEIAKLKDKMSPLTKYGNIIFKSIDQSDIENPTTEVYARNYYRLFFKTNRNIHLIIKFFFNTFHNINCKCLIMITRFYNNRNCIITYFNK